MTGSSTPHLKSRPVFAWIYDRLARNMERGPVGRYRRELLAPVTGRVIEIGGGTGENIKHYSPLATQVIVTEPDRFMLRRAQHQDARHTSDVEFVRAPGESLPFEDETFDAAVATLVLCSVTDQAVVLGEIKRVLRPGGALHFFEHVLDEDSERVAKRQRRWARIWSSIGAGCRPDRHTAEAIGEAGFEITEIRRFPMPGAPKLVRPHIFGEARKPE